MITTTMTLKTGSKTSKVRLKVASPSTSTTGVKLLPPYSAALVVALKITVANGTVDK